MNKKIYTLLGVLIGLILIFFIVKKIYEPNIYSNEEINKIISLKDIKKIEISTEKENTIIEKKENEWYMTTPYNWKAEQNTIQQIITKLENSKIYGPLSEDEKLYFKFDITEKSPKITLTSQKNFSFLIGKEASSFNSIFIKPQDKKGIYELNGISTFDIRREAKEFLERKIILPKDEEIEKIKITYNLKEINLTKNGNLWDSEKSDKIYQKLKEIRFSDIEKKSSQKTEKHLIEIVLTAKSKNYIFKIYSNNKKYTIEINDLILKLDEFDSKKIDELKEMLKK